MFPRVISILIAIAVVASTRTHSVEEDTTPPLPRPIQRPRAPASEIVDLGRDLFLDPRLSRTEKISCASCHQPDKGFSNGERFGVGVDSRVGSRNVPGLVNIALSNTFFWDGRAATLQEQALGPIEHPDEMDMRPAALAAKLNRMEAYRKRFEAVFGGGATPERIGRAIAAFETTLVVDDTPFDRFLSCDRNALSDSARRGMNLFFGEARCSACHSGANLSDGKFHNIGAAEPREFGRRKVTGKETDHGAFRTPQLREVARTAPYMHNGRFATLREVVEHYNFGGVTKDENDHRDPELRVLYLNEDQVADLVAFLEKGLTRPAKTLVK